MSENDDAFSRTRMLLGNEGISRLQNASVMLVGLGAVGGYVLEALARAGVGRLILVDFDKFEPSNLNRQILALHSTLGLAKTEAARRRVLDINPACRVENVDMFVNAGTLPQLLDYSVDFVVDAIDSLNAKCCLMEALYKRGIPFVSSMGAALKTDASFVKCGPLSASKNCGLAKFVRRRLRKRDIDISRITCVYSDEPVKLPPTALEEADEGDEAGRSRRKMGSLPTITAIFGLTAANYVITRLSGYQKQKDN